MIAELCSSVWLVVELPGGCPMWLAIAGATAAALTWISTAAVQVPLHRRLSSGFEAGAHRALVRTNRARTAAWSAHALIVLIMAGLAMG